MDAETTLTRLVVLVHPMGHVHDAPDHPYFHGHYDEYFAYCEAVAAAWRTAISKLARTEALFIIPSRPASQAMDDLERFARRQLGPRCTVTRDVDGETPPFEDLGQEFPARVGREVLAGACLRRGFETREAVTTCINALAYVEDIRSGLRQGGYAIDGATTRVEAWGQAFEGCVSKYAATIGRYLGLAEPVAVDVAQSIPDAYFVWLRSRFVERMLLQGRYHLFLFEAHDGQPFGLFLDGFYSLHETVHRAVLAADADAFRLVNKAAATRYPLGRAASDALFERDRRLHVPVGVGFHAENESLYICAENMTLPQLREALANAAFAPMP